jgi:hypothetical protein
MNSQKSLEKNRTFNALYLLIVIISLSFVIKIVPVSQNSFPLNDGGMFYSIIQDILEAGFDFPKIISYNQDLIPFGYPPLSFYLIAAISKITNWPIIDIMRFFPLIFQTLTIPIVYILSKKILNTNSEALFSTLIYSFIPRSFTWLTMGGGITRAPVVFFSVLGAYYLYNLYTNPSKKTIIISAIVWSLALMTHPIAPLLISITTLVFFIFKGRSKRSFLNTFYLFLLIVGITSPWWVNVLSSHGFSPFLFALTTRKNDYLYVFFYLFTFSFTEENIISIFSVFGLLGTIIKLIKKDYFLICWFFAIAILNTRNAMPFSLVIFAMLGGIAINKLIFSGLNRLFNPEYSQEESIEVQLQPTWAKFVFGLLLAFGVLSSFIAFEALYPSNQKSLSMEERSAMDWVSQNTSTNSRFIVFGQDKNWYLDKSSEWFPVIAQRKSILTVQGSEWLPGEYKKREVMYDATRLCSVGGEDCLLEILEPQNIEFTHIYISKTLDENKDLEHTNNDMLIQSLMQSSNFEDIYHNDEVIIFLKKN